MGFFDDLFGSDDGDQYSQASGIYQNYLNQALAQLQKSQAQGRQDITGYMAPYTQAGQQGLSSYLASLGLQGGKGAQSSVDQFRTSPGYQFAVQQGLQGVQRGMAAQGLSGSGAEASALQRQAQGLADQEYGQYQGRLANLAGMGQQSAEFAGGQLAGLGEQYGGTIAQLYGTMGQAQANALLAQAAQQAQNRQAAYGALGNLAGSAASFFI